VEFLFFAAPQDLLLALKSDLKKSRAKSCRITHGCPFPLLGEGGGGREGKPEALRLRVS